MKKIIAWIGTLLFVLTLAEAIPIYWEPSFGVNFHLGNDRYMPLPVAFDLYFRNLYNDLISKHETTEKYSSNDLDSTLAYFTTALFLKNCTSSKGKTSYANIFDVCKRENFEFSWCRKSEYRQWWLWLDKNNVPKLYKENKQFIPGYLNTTICNSLTLLNYYFTPALVIKIKFNSTSLNKPNSFFQNNIYFLTYPLTSQSNSSMTEPAILFFLGSSLIGLAGLGRKKKILNRTKKVM